MRTRRPPTTRRPPASPSRSSGWRRRSRRQGSGPFFNGAGYALVDAAYAPFLQRYFFLDRVRKLGHIENFPRLKAWARGPGRAPIDPLLPAGRVRSALSPGTQAPQQVALPIRRGATGRSRMIGPAREGEPPGQLRFRIRGNRLGPLDLGAISAANRYPPGSGEALAGSAQPGRSTWIQKRLQAARIIIRASRTMPWCAAPAISWPTAMSRTRPSAGSCARRMPLRASARSRRSGRVARRACSRS